MQGIIEFLSLNYVLLSLCTVIFMLFKITTRHFKAKSLDLPPGPRKFPLIGNMHLFASSRPQHHIMADLALKYGGLMHLRVGEVTTIVVSSAEAAKQVLKTHGTTFAFRPSLFVPEIMFHGNTDITFASYDKYWRKVRKICTSELLSTKRIQSLRPVREEEVSNFCRWIASKAGSTINLTDRIVLTTFDIITRASFGKKTNEQVTFVRTIKQSIELLAGFHIADVYPSIKLFRLVGGTKSRVERLHQELDRILENIINEHKVATNASRNHVIDHESEEQEDLVDVLLKFHDAGEEFRLTTDNIKVVLLDMFTAGTETSSTTIDWAMAEMMKHPRILKVVIKETLRMHPSLPLLVPRESSEPCEINGYRIPAKATVLVNAWAIGKDPKYWEEAESFKPERFLDNTVDYKGNNFEYIPFGAGKRICPGMSFGLANVELPLAMLLYYFDWSLPNGTGPEQVDMTESCGALQSVGKTLYM